MTNILVVLGGTDGWNPGLGPELIFDGKTSTQASGAGSRDSYFIINFPKEISPLAKTHRENDDLVERFELFIGGMEIANSFTELNDPIDQLERLNNQLELRAKGDKEAQVVDHSFIEAMEIGMPPTGGVGVGIDRLAMLLTGNTSIKDVILFPAMRS